MDTPGPQEAAVRDGAPLSGPGRDLDPALVTAERVIAQLRATVAALVLDRQDPVTLSRDQLADPRVGSLRVRQGLDGSLSLQVSRERVEPGPSVEAVPRLGNSALLRRLARLAAEHPAAGADAAEGDPPPVAEAER